MKALLFTQEQQLAYVEQPTPDLDKNPPIPQALIQIEACGICGSDVHAWHGHDERRRPPLILGHEISGEVIGSTNAQWLGKRVTINPFITCGNCRYCQSNRENICENRKMAGLNLPGGFAEFMLIPEKCLILIPDALDSVAAALTEPVAVCLHGIALSKKYGTNNKHEAILVIGAGAIGLVTALILQSEGYTNIILCDNNSLRLDNAGKTFKGTLINNTKQALTDKFDTIFDCVGSDITRNISTDQIADGGCIMHLGLQKNGGGFNARRLTIGEIAFIGTFTYTLQELHQALEFINSGKLGNLSWLEKRPLADGQQAFKDIHSTKTPKAKIVLIP